MSATQEIDYGAAAQLDIRIARGQDWTATFRACNMKDILSSTNATPTVLTVTAHGLTSGNTVYVTGHLVNTAANTTAGVAITKITDNTYSLTGVAANGTGGRTGRAGKAIDLTDYTVVCEFRDTPAGAVIATPAVTYPARSAGQFSLTLTSAQTAAITQRTARYDVWLVKSGGTYPVLAGNVYFDSGVTDVT